MRAPGSVASIVASYSLNVDLGQKIIRKQKGVDINTVAQTTQYSCVKNVISKYEPQRKLLFVSDSLSPAELKIISTATTFEYSVAPVNSRMLAYLNCQNYDCEYDPMYLCRHQLCQYLLSGEHVLLRPSRLMNEISLLADPDVTE